METNIDRPGRARPRLLTHPIPTTTWAVALLTASGKVFTGCNVENASFALTICAERTALVKAVSEGETSFCGLAVATADGGTPCGACRQSLAEFCDGALLVILHNVRSNMSEEFTLGELLPRAFGRR